MREGVNRLDAQTHRRTGVNSVREQLFPLPHVCFPRCVCASSSALFLQPKHYCYFIATVLSRAPRTVRPRLEREVFALGGCEADLQKEPGFAGQREHFGEALHARLGDQRREQRAAHARPLPIRAHGECGELRQIARVHLERPATEDLARRPLCDDVLLDVPTETVIRARQQIAGGNVGRHQDLELGDVGKHRTAQYHAREGAGSGEQGAVPAVESRRFGPRRSVLLPAPCSLLPENRQRAHARSSSRIATPRSSSSSVITSGGSRRTTCGPAVTTSRPRSRAAATIGAAGSASSSPHISPRPRTSATRGAPAARRARRAPSHSALRRTSARNAGSAIVRTTSRATLATSGPPPNVVAWSPGFRAAATALVTSTAPIGRPPASGFASVRMSGTTPACS